MKRKEVWCENAVDKLGDGDRESLLRKAYLIGFEDSKKAIADSIRVAEEYYSGHVPPSSLSAFCSHLGKTILKLGDEEV